MSLLMLTKIITFLESNSMFNDTMRLWFSAVCSLSFYGMCRINEVLLMKTGDIQLGLKRKSRVDDSNIEFGCFTIRDRKTDHDPLASRTYSLHHLSNEERAAEALTFLDRWFTYVRKKLHHIWRGSDYAFPSLTKVMLLSDIGEPLNIIAEAAGISRNLLGDEIWFTSHCFRRGGAQYQFMFAPEDRRYLLDDVLDREENQLGDSLALDAASCSSATLEGIPDIDYGGSQLLDDTTQDTQPTTESADRVRPQRSVKKNGCRMKIRLEAVVPDNVEGRWMVVHLAGSDKHNHPPSQDPSFHPGHRRRDIDRLMSSDLTTADVVAAQNGAGVSLQVVISTIRRADPTSSIIDKDISNRKDAERRAALRGDSPTEFLLKQLETNGHFYKVDVNPDNSRLRSLFWSHPDIQDIYGWNSDVLILDCTYKTN
ncbi:hypothetical protein F444_17863 [Phytophthora nicotianae P1976]|uniref:MULE transposase domain-containing protein n=1 Tax=Phytophthora nicotianae P1976 TaxID=1317066 RepID=A0A080ZDE2_PHYNI|nr:hypothetical protein F444_17863 [Phytophthora nicotianae P1976]